MSGLVAALADLLYWVAGVFGGAALLGTVAFVVTRGRRTAVRAAADAARVQIAEQEERRELERHRRKLEIAAASAPRIYNVIDRELLKPAPVIRGEVER